MAAGSVDEAGIGHCEKRRDKKITKNKFTKLGFKELANYIK